MSRPRASVPPEAIRIEDEVWQDAFIRREPASSRRRRLHAIEGGRSATAAPVADPVAEPPATAAPVADPPAERPATPAPRTVAARRPHDQAVAAAPAAAAAPVRPGAGVPGRRTVTIRGYGAERNLPWPDGTRRRPQRRAYERAGFQPDRVAMWAVLLGILLVIVAVASAH